MRRFPIVIIVFVAIVGVTTIVSCAGVGSTSKPTVGTSRTFKANEAQVNLAIINAFTNGHYCDMLVSQAVGAGELIQNWHPTNGFILEPGIGTRYRGYFYIVTTPVVTNQTKIFVQTLYAEVIDGKEPGVHGGWAFYFRKTRPVLQEETNVLTAISEELNSEK